MNPGNAAPIGTFSFATITQDYGALAESDTAITIPGGRPPTKIRQGVSNLTGLARCIRDGADAVPYTEAQP